MDLGAFLLNSAQTVWVFASYVAARVSGSVVGLLSEQVCVMGACIRCAQCGSRKWLRGLCAEWQQCGIL